jgi:hypothetical protein
MPVLILVVLTCWARMWSNPTASRKLPRVSNVPAMGEGPYDPIGPRDSKAGLRARLTRQRARPIGRVGDGWPPGRRTGPPARAFVRTD